ncbi:hypothetical protein ACFC3F_11530 [Microbacterium sp. NPDC055910]|uniref:hypothetical protein n=1 Tax=Microbacterium sp. NPDC055910 TaxID=3345659 RepID=UPI0035DFBE1A
MTKVIVEYSVLNELNHSLKQIIVEFEKAEGRGDALEGQIGAPYGKTRLRDEAAEFESGWNDRRRVLKEDLLTIQDRVESTGREWANWDLEASKSGGVEVNEVDTMPRVN